MSSCAEKVLSCLAQRDFAHKRQVPLKLTAAAAFLAREKAQDEQIQALKQLVEFRSYTSQWQISKWSLDLIL